MGNFYVRPRVPGGYGSHSGQTYENAWNGFDEVRWASMPAGSALRVCGTHIYGRDFAYLKNTVGVSGIVIEGEDMASAIVGARRISSGDFVNRGGGTYSVRFANHAPFSWLGDPLAKPRPLMPVDSEAMVRSIEGSAWRDIRANTLWVHPYGGVIDDVYSNWIGALLLNGQSGVTVRNLRLFGGAGGDGVVRLTKGHGPVRDITIVGCELACGTYTGVYAKGNTQAISIRDTKIHAVPSGTYTVGGQHNRWSVECVSVVGGDDVWDTSDRHAIGGQNISNLRVIGCRVVQWPGDGVLNYMTLGGRMDDVVVDGCWFANLVGKGYHFGVAKHGDAASDFGVRSLNWRISNNVFARLSPDGVTLGSGYAVRGKGDTGGAPCRIEGNLFANAGRNIFWPTPVGYVAQDNVEA